METLIDSIVLFFVGITVICWGWFGFGCGRLASRTGLTLIACGLLLEMLGVWTFMSYCSERFAEEVGYYNSF